MSDTEYCYPPDFTVLKNKAGLRDAADLELFERLNSRKRTLFLPTDIPVSEAGYREIHRHLFQDIYDWAGEYRRVNISKETTQFALAPFISPNMKRVFRELDADQKLQGLDQETFSHRAAVYLDDINHIHCFRDGNGRTQRLFLKNLAKQAGYKFDLTRIPGDEWIKASIESMHRSNYEPMARIIYAGVEGRSRPRDPGRAR